MREGREGSNARARRLHVRRSGDGDGGSGGGGGAQAERGALAPEYGAFTVRGGGGEHAGWNVGCGVVRAPVGCTAVVRLAACAPHDRKVRHRPRVSVARHRVERDGSELRLLLRRRHFDRRMDRVAQLPDIRIHAVDSGAALVKVHGNGNTHECAFLARPLCCEIET